RIVCPCACVETLAHTVSHLRGERWRRFECTQLSIARGVAAGKQLRFEALNPVWIAAADVVSEDGAAGPSRRDFAFQPPPKPSLGES
ncbi:MAG: hypothetical protein JW990_21350, partial [Thermoleophilia bacterium]|nr:hypothetical protein [Thermoleophilia bacterium]